VERTALPPHRDAALERIARVQPSDYARTRNHLEGAVTGLSPYLTHGLVTLREVLEGVVAREALSVQHKLVFELGWREFFRHAWRHSGDQIFQSLHTGPQVESAYDPVLPVDIREGRTGVPVVDEAVRTLYATGTLHNHARMWLASYLVHLRRVHWRAGADWLVAHLFDGDLGSNHLSWQWVAGTGSHKPYLFNAENVARFAPAAWHSPRTVVDQSYEQLEQIARGTRVANAQVLAQPHLPAPHPGVVEPALQVEPPTGLGILSWAGDDPAALAVAEKRLRGREVWLVHPWALREPPPDLPASALVIGLYLREHHATWPWPEARWRWVDTAMAGVTGERWLVDAPGLQRLLASASRVRSVDDPHITRWLHPLAQLDAAPALFPQVDRPCSSFSQWWTRATRGMTDARGLL
jgi:deoxyribodipyrimidine photo-lyase